MFSAVPNFGKNKPLITGLEWEDPLHVNVLSCTETRKLNLIITQIAVLVNKRKIALRPYFQDYELVHSARFIYGLLRYFDVIILVIYSIFNSFVCSFIFKSIHTGSGLIISNNFLFKM